MTTITIPTPTEAVLADPRPVFARAVATTAAVLAAVAPEQSGDPTPCTDFDVRTIEAHLLGVLDRVAAIGRGEEPMAVEPNIEVDDGDFAGAWAAKTAEQVEAWSDEDALRREVTLPWMSGSGARVLAAYTNDIVVHTWDVAAAIGQQPDWDDEVVAVAAAGIEGTLPAEGRAALFAAIRQSMPQDTSGWGDPFAEVVPVATDAPAIDRLIAFMGRDPHWTA